MSRIAAILPILTICSSIVVADIPPEYTVSVSADAGGIYVLPDGSAPPLSALGLTVTVTIVDHNWLPVVGFPKEDIQLVDAVGGLDLSLCAIGWTANQNTDAAGTTTIEGAGFAGGQTDQGLQVRFTGLLVNPTPPLDIRVVSADLDGNLEVNLLDLSAVPDGFVARFNDPLYSWEIDFNHDGVLNLIDVARMAMAMGAGCP